jgi:hypothetical protein
VSWRSMIVKLALGGSLLLEVGPGLAANFNLKLKGPPGLADSDGPELARYWQWRPHCMMHAGCPSPAYKVQPSSNSKTGQGRVFLTG